MTDSWQTFLNIHGAHYQNGKLCDFGNTRGEQAAIDQGEMVLASLEHKSIIEVSGEDARSFLHGQFSNSLDEVNENHSQISSYSSAKGRLFAVFRLYQTRGKYYLILPKSLSATIVKRLTMFKLRAKVQINDISEETGIIGIAGKHAEITLARHFRNVPAAINAVSQADSNILLRIPGSYPRFKIVSTYKNLESIWEKLKAEAKPIGEDAWERLTIEAGIPTIYPETSEEFVAQMVNLDYLNGINFKKGCYPGQEIIARMHYLGKLKRRMFLIHIEDSHTHPEPAMPIYHKSSENTESVGMIVDARPNTANGYLALAVIQIENANSGALRIANMGGSSVKVLPLPYKIA